MKIATLEHINITVSDPRRTAAMLRRIFNWHIRWEGKSMDNGYTVHVGTKESYVALYGKRNAAHTQAAPNSPTGLNHIALVVPDLDAIEKRVKAEGLKPHNHGNYQPGRRFYFHDTDGVEFEVVSYASEQNSFRRAFMRQLGSMARSIALTR